MAFVAPETGRGVRRQLTFFLAAGPARRITLEFGRAERFDGHGIQVRCGAGGAEYQAPGTVDAARQR